MSREDFMRQLEMLLADVPQEERQEALSYYQSYFEDAGVENEERILRELDSPQKVAATIKADLGMEAGDSVGEYTEHGFMDSRFQDRQEMKAAVSLPKEQEPKAKEAGGGAGSGYQGTHQQEGAGSGYQRAHQQEGEAFGYQEQGNDRQGKGDANYWGGAGPEGPGGYRHAYGNGGNAGYGNRSRSTYNGSQVGKILLLIAIAVLTSPAWLGLLGGVGSLVIGLAVAAVCVTGAFFIAGGVLFGVGIGQMATGSLAVGFALSGAGMLVLALAILCTLLCVWVCGKLFPWFCRAVRGLWRGFFSRKEQML